MKEFNVYLLLDPRKPFLKECEKKYLYKDSKFYGELKFDFEPFYVGKGKVGRAESHLKNVYKQRSNDFRLNKIKKIKTCGLLPIILIYKECLEEQEAFLLERGLISKIGRFDLDLGPLTNLTDGGDFNGYRPNISKQVGRKISESLLKHPEQNSQVKRDLWNNSAYRQKQMKAKRSKRYHDLLSVSAKKQMLTQWKDTEYAKKMIEVHKRPKTQKWKDSFKNSDFQENLRKIEYKISGKETISLFGKLEVIEWCKKNNINRYTLFNHYLNKNKPHKGYFLSGGKHERDYNSTLCN